MMLNYWYRNRKIKWSLKFQKHRFQFNKHSLIENHKSMRSIKFIHREMNWLKRRKIFIKRWTITKKTMLKNSELSISMRNIRMKSFQSKERNKELMNEFNCLTRNVNKLENKLQTTLTKINFYKSKKRN